MDTKIMLGVSHSEEGELEEVIATIDQNLPLQSAGLELPEDYLVRRQHGLYIGFYFDIVDHLDERGIKIVPLETPKRWDTHGTLELAKAVREGQMTEEEFNVRLRNYQANLKIAMDESERFRQKFFSDLYQDAQQILQRSPTLENVMVLWDEANKNRERYQRRVIKRRQPDLIIIGSAHAEQMLEEFPQYRYIPFNPLK